MTLTPAICVERVPDRVRARYRRHQEAATQAVLYGQRGGHVTPLGADGPPVTFVYESCDVPAGERLDGWKKDGPDGGSAGAAQTTERNPR